MKHIIKVTKVAVAIILIVIGTICLLSATTKVYSGLESGHFDGRSFFNPEPDHSFMDMLNWYKNMETVDWPEWIEDTVQPVPPKFISGSQIRITYINHATILIQVDSINILTDPIWSMHAGPTPTFGVKRIRKPGVSIDSLPPIHFILISHNHYDHFDIQTLKELYSRHEPTIICGLGVDRLLKRKGINRVEALDWWETYQTQKNGLTINFVPARHQSARGITDGNKTLWGGFVIESNAGNLYFAGDTGYGQFIDSLKNRFDKFDVAILPLGNYESREFMKGQHMNPSDAVKIHQKFNVKQSIAMHFGTFAEHPEQTVDEHEKDLNQALREKEIDSSEFIIPQFGQGITITIN